MYVDLALNSICRRWGQILRSPKNARRHSLALAVVPLTTKPLTKFTSTVHSVILKAALAVIFTHATPAETDSLTVQRQIADFSEFTSQNQVRSELLHGCFFAFALALQVLAEGHIRPCGAVYCDQ